MDRDDEANQDLTGARHAERGTRSGESSDFRLPTSERAPLEAMLSSLAPRAAQFERDRLMFLAGQASVLPLPLGEGRGEGFGKGPEQGEESCGGAALTLTLSQRETGPERRWAWPAAFSAMTAVAATLLVMVVNRPEPRVIERIVRVPIDAPSVVAAAPLAEREHSEIESERPLPAPRSPASFGETYLHARNQVLAFGLDSWMQTKPALAAASDGAPATYRKLRDSLLQ